ncbi:MAG: S-layer homology domain-containing protein, partial [Bacillota bacterium]|nr:S-layer homology domain-containing protein [Bacillota bacterium]
RDRRIPPPRQLEASAMVGKVGGAALKGVGFIGKVKSVGKTITEDTRAQEKEKVAAIKAELEQIKDSSMKRCGCLLDPNGAAAQEKIMGLYLEGVREVDSIIEGLDMQENVNDGIDVAQDVAPTKSNVWGLVATFSIDMTQEVGNDVADSSRWTSVNEVYKKYYNGISRASFVCDPKECKTPEQESEKVVIDPLARKASVYIGPTFEMKQIIDPSGVVYEGFLGNPLEGVTCTIQELVGQNWTDWDVAPGYNNQQTTITTNQSGYYRWDVPRGKWRVKYQKDGYNGSQPLYSQEMNVPPIWLDVNQNMLATAAAAASATSQGGNIIVSFSKPVQFADIDATSAAVNIGGSPASGTWQVVTGGMGDAYESLNFDGEGKPQGVSSSAMLVTEVMFVPDPAVNMGMAYTVSLSDEIKGYNGTTITGGTNLSGTIAGGTAPPVQGSGGNRPPVSTQAAVTVEKETVLLQPAGNTTSAFDGAVKLTAGAGLVTADTKVELTQSTGGEAAQAYSPLYGVVFTVQPSDTVEISFKLDDSAKSVSNPLLLGVWVRETGSADWSFAGGAYDEASNTLTLLTRVNGDYQVRYTEYSFPDVGAGHWAKDYLDVLASRQIMLGDGQGNANPDAPVTRAETAAMIVRVLQANSLIGRTPEVEDNFSDVKEGAWYYYAMNLAAKRGILSGYGDGTARPDDPITRAELAAVIARTVATAEQLSGDRLPKARDAERIPSWAKTYVAVLEEMGFLSGDDKGNFNPDANATRAEVGKLMYKLMEEYGMLYYDPEAPEAPCLSCPYSR